MTIITALLAIIMPWILGFSVVKPLLKQRYGYRSLAWGVGYPVGWFLVTVLIHVCDVWARPLDVMELLAVQTVIALPLLLMPARRCSMEEQRFEKASANIVYFVVFVLSLALLYRWALLALELLDGKGFDIDPTKATSGQDFVTLVKFYISLTWGNHAVGALPWLGVAIASALALFGGLRYLGAPLLAAFLGVYALSSVPLWTLNVTTLAENYWTGLALLCLTLLVVISLVYREWRMLPVIAALITLVWLSDRLALLFVIGLVWVIICYYSNVFLALMFVGGAVALAYFKGLLPSFLAMLSSWGLELSNDFPEASTIFHALWQYWQMSNEWHYLLVLCVLSLLILLIRPINIGEQRFAFLASVGVGNAAVVGLLIALLPLSTQGSEQAKAIMISHLVHFISPYFLPLLALIPVSIYQLTVLEEREKL